MSRSLMNGAWRWSSIATAIVSASAAFAEPPASIPPDQNGQKLTVTTDQPSDDGSLRIVVIPEAGSDQPNPVGLRREPAAADPKQGLKYTMVTSESGEKFARAEVSDADKAMLAGRSSTYLGVAVSSATPALRAQLGLPAETGLVVDEVMSDSPAQKGGVQQYDVLQKLDDQILVDPNQLAVLVRMHKPGDSVELSLIRHGQPTSIKIALASGPARFSEGDRSRFEVKIPFLAAPENRGGMGIARPAKVPERPGAGPSETGQAEAKRLYARRDQLMQEVERKLRAAVARPDAAPNSPSALPPARKLQAQLAQLELEAAKIQLERQKVRVEELNRLKSSGAVNDSEMQAAQFDLRLAEIQMKRAEINFEVARHVAEGE